MSLFLTLISLVTPAAPASAVAPEPTALFQEEADEKPDKREEIKELVDALRDHTKKRGAEDREAIAVIDKMVSEFPNCGPKDRASIVKSLDKCFTLKRKDLEEGVPDNRLFLAAAVALGEMGPESCKALISWIDDKRHRKDLNLQRRLILALGKTQGDDAVKPLVDLLVHKEATLIAASAEALGEFGEKPSKERKEIFEAVLKSMMSAKNATDADVNDLIARERWDVISAPLITCLQRITGQEIRDPNKWRDWWNDNKRADWDDPDE